MLDELSLPECNEFWHDWPGILAPYEKFKILSATGGVPRYLEELQPNLTAEQNIQQLCFHREGLLFREFNQMFSDLFDKKAEFYKQIVTQLIDSRFAASQVAKALGKFRGGDISDALITLKESGFLARDYTWSLTTQQQSKISRYRVSDNYLRFYLKYIHPNAERIKAGQMQHLPPGWHGIMGLQFENLVINQGRKLSELLEIGSDSIVHLGSFLQTKQSRRTACQIDYLIQTEFKTLFLFEIKFHQKPIGIDVILEVQNKLNALQLPHGFSCRPILVHVNGVTSGVVDSGFFAKIINFSDLLE